MLSPGKWHALVPRGPAKHVRWRIATLKAARTDKKLQQGLLAMCRQDLLFFVALFVWQFNPRNWQPAHDTQSRCLRPSRLFRI